MIDLKEYKRMIMADKAEDVANWIRCNESFLIDNDVAAFPATIADLLETIAYVLRDRQS